MDGDRFIVGEVAMVRIGRFAGMQCEIVDELAPRIVMVIRGYRVEKETYRVLMPHGEIWSVVPEYLGKRPWRCANADALVNTSA
jgi:ribosomal protein L14E/L6E/L27E